MSTILIQNSNLLDIEKAEIIEGVNVLIEENKISELGDKEIKSSTATKIDARGKTLMPGLTAYFGFLDVCSPMPGDTVVVSAASGSRAIKKSRNRKMNANLRYIYNLKIGVL